MTRWDYWDNEWKDGEADVAVVCDPKVTTSTTVPTTTAKPTNTTSSTLIIILATTAILAMTAVMILLVLCLRKTRKKQIQERVSQAGGDTLVYLRYCICVYLYICAQGTIEMNADYGTYCDGVVYNTVEDRNDYYSTLGVED